MKIQTNKRLCNNNKIIIMSTAPHLLMLTIILYLFYISQANVLHLSGVFFVFVIRLSCTCLANVLNLLCMCFVFVIYLIFICFVFYKLFCFSRLSLYFFCWISLVFPLFDILKFWHFYRNISDAKKKVSNNPNLLCINQHSKVHYFK